MSEPLLLRQDGEIEAISTAPSVNQTPVGPVDVPVPYQVLADLAGAVGCLSDVFFNGKPAFVMDLSSVPTCSGDDAGTSNGVKSGTLNGEVKPLAGSPTVLAHGKPVIRKGDPCAMQGGNTVGIFTANPGPSPQPREDDPPPPDLEDSLEPETEEEREPPPEAVKHATEARRRLEERLAQSLGLKSDSKGPLATSPGGPRAGDKPINPTLAALERLKAQEEFEFWCPKETIRRKQKEWVEEFNKGRPPAGMPQITNASTPLELTPAEKLEAGYRAALRDRLAKYRFWTENPLLYMGQSQGRAALPFRRIGLLPRSVQRSHVLLRPQSGPGLQGVGRGGHIPPKTGSGEGTGGNRSLGAGARLKYEPAPYHGNSDNPIKSRAPFDGQAALDVSVQIKSTP